MIAAYQGRVETSDQISETWFLLLRDLDEVSVFNATLDILSESREWPPTPGQIRDRAIDIARGELVSISPTEAWERVCASAQGDSVQLNQKERRALKVCGGTWEIKNSQRIGATRAVFMQHYEALCRSEKRIAATVPEVALAAKLDATALPQPKSEPRLAPTPTKQGTPAQVSAILDGYVFREEMDNVRP